jgi:hypothetical protein
MDMNKLRNPQKVLVGKTEETMFLKKVGSWIYWAWGSDKWQAPENKVNASSGSIKSRQILQEFYNY